MTVTQQVESILRDHKICTDNCDKKVFVSTYCYKHYHLRVKENRITWRRKEAHGMSNTPEYHTWHDMKMRCNNPKDQKYEWYGGRGIKVCKRWGYFGKFLEDMGKRPSNKHSIERINNNKGYSPNNCKWATKSEQMVNRRVQKNNTSGFVGISILDKPKPYMVYLSVNGETKYLGKYADFQEAVNVRLNAEVDTYGDILR